MDGSLRYLALAILLALQLQCDGKKGSPDVVSDSVPKPDAATPADIALDQLERLDDLLDGDSPARLEE
jgi:hypothetical protein